MRQTGVLITSDGWRLRWGQWPVVRAAHLAGQAVVVLGGRCEFLEGYDDIAAEWVGRGYPVFSFDWRGQGLSGRFLANRHKGHVPDFTVLADDLALFLTEIVAPATAGRPPILFAHSMGGLIAVLHLLQRPELAPQAVILSAPMLDLHTRPWPRAMAQTIAAAAAALGFGDRYAFGQGDYDPARDAVFEGNPRTSDSEQFFLWHRAVADNPDLALGGVTFGWLAAAFRAFWMMAEPGTLERLDRPLLVLSAPDDQLIPAAAHHALARRAQRTALCSYPGARHELLREAAPIRRRVWRDIDQFLARVARVGG